MIQSFSFRMGDQFQGQVNDMLERQLPAGNNQPNRRRLRMIMHSFSLLHRLQDSAKL